jgi:hypothetical protein
MAVLPTGIGPVTNGYQIERSLRFNKADSAYLNRTPGSASNRKTFTFSVWYKKVELVTGDYYPSLFSARNAGTYDFFNFNPNTDQLTFNGNLGHNVTTNNQFRDFSAWYHIVLLVDTTQATAANRIKIYINGSEATYSSATYPSQNADLAINSTIQHRIGAQNAGDPMIINGYMTEIYFIDGQALTPSSFGETDSSTGVWKAKKYAGTYGTNGFYLNFADNSGTTSTTLGKDSSGNGNNWTPNNFSVTAGVGNDSLVDSPTAYGTDTGVGGTVRGNYPTLNPLDNSLTLTNGNLLASRTSASWASSRTTIQGITSGKWYFECQTTSTIGASNYPMIGWAWNKQSLSSFVGQDAYGYGCSFFSGQKFNNNVNTNYGSAFATNDVMGIAFDADNGKIWFSKNGTWFASGDPVAGTNAAFTGITGLVYSPTISLYGTSTSVDVNFGQRAFAYTAPSGFKALCTTNLPTPTIGATSTTQANDYFNAVLYTGDDTDRTITFGMQPDLIWTKGRNAAVGNRWSDSVRGASGGLMYNLVSQATTAENTDTVVTGIVSTGFTLTGGNHPNNTGTTYVAWGWNAANSNATNTSGTITSTVRANTTSGFSIVTYTGNGSANQTVGHGLGVAPAFGILKDRDPNSNNDQWQIFHTGAGDKYGYFTTAAFAGTAEFYPTSGSSTTVTIARGSPAATTNESGDRYVMYLFTPVAGYSAFGSFTGNGNANGPFVYLGFRPAFVMAKLSSATGDWNIVDDNRQTYNDASGNPVLRANLSSVEEDVDTMQGQMDLLSNGFKLRSNNSSLNLNGGTIIYAAFAEFPFRYSLAR